MVKTKFRRSTETNLGSVTNKILKLLEKNGDSTYKLSKYIQEGKQLARMQRIKIKDWYSEIGITEDKASELLRLYKLFDLASKSKLDFEKAKNYLSRITIHVALVLAKKTNSTKIVLKIIELELQDIKKIREMLGIPTKTKLLFLELAERANKEYRNGDPKYRGTSKELERIIIDFNKNN